MNFLHRKQYLLELFPNKEYKNQSGLIFSCLLSIFYNFLDICKIYLFIGACPNNCNNFKFIKSISKNELLSKIKYKCKNCNEEVFNDNIKTHLESNCKKKIERTKTLGELYKTKKALEKLSPEEMKEIDKNLINHFTGK